MLKVLKLRLSHWQSMRRHVIALAPLEACGLLAGKQDTVEAVLRVRNAEKSPVRFRMDPQEQLNAFEWMEANGLDLIGIYHSHPSGPETASATDIAEAAYAVVHVIWSRLNRTWKARGVWIEAGTVTDVKIQIVSEQ
ncbi:MAG: M67 family metallopeptidase [Anaerolineales bacterium]|jgi:proteasome lid subunit RPN8/RPN11